MRDNQKQKNRVIIFTVFILFFCTKSSISAAMYACRSTNGKKHYTNVRLNSNCKEVSFTRPVHRIYKPEPLVIDVSKRDHKSVAKKKVYKSNWIGRLSGGSKGSNKYDNDIQNIAGKYGVDPLLIKAIIHIESGFNHRAVSHKGAQGLMQLMPQTAQDLRVWNAFDPLQNIDGGTRYISRILKAFNGDLHLSLAAYNAGPNLVERIGRIPAIPETRNYVRKVISQYNYYKKNGKKRIPNNGIKVVANKKNTKIIGKN